MHDAILRTAANRAITRPHLGDRPAVLSRYHRPWADSSLTQELWEAIEVKRLVGLSMGVRSKQALVSAFVVFGILVAGGASIASADRAVATKLRWDLASDFQTSPNESNPNRVIITATQQASPSPSPCSPHRELDRLTLVE